MISRKLIENKKALAAGHHLTSIRLPNQAIKFYHDCRVLDYYEKHLTSNLIFQH